MYAKMMNGVLHRAPKKVMHNNKQVFNPTADMLKELGYLPIEQTDPPEETPEGYYYKSRYEQTDTAIVQIWELAEAPEEVSGEEATAADYLDALERLGVK